MAWKDDVFPFLAVFDLFDWFFQSGYVTEISVWHVAEAEVYIIFVSLVWIPKENAKFYLYLFCIPHFTAI